MKIATTFTALLLLSIGTLSAQTTAPKGFKTGSVMLADSSVLQGFVKDNIKSNATVSFQAGTSSKKTTYAGADILSVTIEGDTYACIKGDFFKVICQGELCFLQKASDATGKMSYAGNEVVFSAGTEGKPGDFFLYSAAGKELVLVSKKNFDEVVTNSFHGYTAAIDKAKSANGDLAQVKDAVIIYNNRNK
jgi:hypothetical protein